MKQTNRFLISSLMIFVFVTTASAQFEQKVTLQVSWSYHHPLGEKAFTEVFGNGFSMDAGIQYNMSRSFSLAALLKYTTFKANVGPVIKEGSFKNIGISLCPKIKFLPSKKINPYIFAGGSMSKLGLSFMTILGTESTYDPPIAFGYTGGAGIDLKISDRFGIFIQGGYNAITFTDKNSDSKMKINSVYGEAGFHFSFLKSKSL